MLLSVAILLPFLVAFGMARIMWEHRHSRPVTLPLGVTIGVLLAGLFWVLPNDWLVAGVRPALAVIVAFGCWALYYWAYPAR